MADGIMEEKCRSSAKRAACTETLDTKLPSISPAKRFRYDIAGQTPFEVVPQLCLRGRHLKVPIVLPTLSQKDMRKIAGRVLVQPFVRLANRDAWISSVVMGRVAGGTLMDVATKRVRQQFLQAVLASEKQKLQVVTSGAAACRRQLMGGTDSDTEAANEEDTAVSPVGSGIYTIEHGGLTFEVVKKASQVYVQGTPEILSHVCSACFDVIADETVLATEKDAALAACPDTDDATVAARLETGDKTLAACPLPPVRTPMQQGGLPVHNNNSRVQWVHRSHCFQVTYTASSGKKLRTVKDLTVPEKDKEGRPLSPDAYRNGFRRALRNAQETWNRMDMSPQDRYDVGDEL